MALMDIPLHVDAVTDECKLPWQKYLKVKYVKNNQALNPSASFSLAANYMIYGTELMARLCIIYNYCALKCLMSACKVLQDVTVLVDKGYIN